jgi:hypothetical protein
MEKIMSKTDGRTKIMDAQQTSEVRELTAVELDTVAGGADSPTILGFAAIAVVHAVFEGVVLPVMNTHL